MTHGRSLLDALPLPRFTFHGPDLRLVSHSPSAAPFLAAAPASAAGPDPSCPTFDALFRPLNLDAYSSLSAWLAAALTTCAAGELDRAVQVLPLRDPERRACTASVFLGPNGPAGGLGDGDVLHVVLLASVNLLHRPAPPVRQPSGSDHALGATHAGGKVAMSTAEVDHLLLRSTKGTLDPTVGRKLLADAEVRALVDDLPEIAFLTANTGEVTWFNKKWYNYTGLSAVSSTDFDKFRATFHPDDLPAALNVWKVALATSTPYSFEYRVRSKEGALRWHVCKGRPVWDEAGRVKHWTSTIVDVEELVAARSEAVAMRAHIQNILLSSQTVVLSVSADLRVTFFEGSPHPAAHGSLVGRALRDAWPDDHLANEIQRMIDHDVEATTLRTCISRRGVRQYYRYTLTPRRAAAPAGDEDDGAPGVQGVSAIGTDITEMVEAEEELKKAAAEKAKLIASETAALEASRLKTEYFTHISHETRTPVAGIISIAELLLADKTLQEEHRLLVSQALRSGEILLELVGMVLDLRKVESGELKLERAQFTLADVLEDAKLFSVIAKKKGLAFIEEVGPLFPGTLVGDRMRLRQILANGLSNAAKFTDRGHVTLQVTQVHETRTRVHVQFTVVDTGVGIASAVLPSLFQPFRQADSSTARRYGGTGLGLVITRELVTMMGGQVGLESEEGEGTTMTITVALEKDGSVDSATAGAWREGGTMAAVAGVGAAASKESAVVAFRRRRQPDTVRILLAEDNELLRDLTVRILRKMRFAVVAVDDGQQAVDELHHGAYDLVLMDGQMPVKDGYMATREIRADPDPRIAGVRIVALTASAFEGDRERCLRAGMSHYISKPVRAKDLEQAIWEQLCEQEAGAATAEPPRACNGRALTEEMDEHVGPATPVASAHTTPGGTANGTPSSQFDPTFPSLDSRAPNGRVG